MPTWCDCDLTLIAEASDEIKRFIQHNFRKSIQTHIDAESYIPSPSDNEIDLNEWFVTNWGARSNMMRVKEIYPFKEGNTRHQYSFRTIGTPPIPVIKAMSAMFPDIIFILEYYEKVQCIRGMTKFQRGLLMHEESGEYYGTRGGIG
ncbi:MAG: hypothetical protein ACFFDR_03525 [Candidatus Thorarchaeota archaeon]